MATLEMTMVAMIFTLALLLPPRRLFPKDSSSCTLLPTRIDLWKTVFTHWSGEEHGDTTMGTGRKMMCFGQMYGHTAQSPKSNAAMFHSPITW